MFRPISCAMLAACSTPREPPPELPVCDPAITCEQPAGVLDLASAWPRHRIHHGLLGADGVDLADIDGDGQLDVVSGWEQSSKVTVSIHPCACDVREPWPTVALPNEVGGVEHAIFADVDGDGRLDVIAGGEQQTLYIYFAPSDRADLLDEREWHPVRVGAAQKMQRWVQLVFVDIDGDGTRDIVAGGRVQPASVGYFTSTTPRDGESWVWHPVGTVGCTESLVPHDADGDGDLDLVVSDRDPIEPPAPDLLGARWLENPGTGVAGEWPYHVIQRAGGESGRMRFIDVRGDSLIIGSSSETTTNQSMRLDTADWLAWTSAPIPQPDSVGLYQDVERGDLDGDGREDLAFSYSHADGALSGVVWLRDDGAGGWQRGEISGPDGIKYDNLVLHDVDGDGDLDVITSEQGLKDITPVDEQLGVIWYENPR